MFRLFARGGHHRRPSRRRLVAWVACGAVIALGASAAVVESQSSKHRTGAAPRIVDAPSASSAATARAIALKFKHSVVVDPGHDRDRTDRRPAERLDAIHRECARRCGSSADRIGSRLTRPSRRRRTDCWRRRRPRFHGVFGRRRRPTRQGRDVGGPDLHDRRPGCHAADTGRRRRGCHVPRDLPRCRSSTWLRTVLA